MRKSVLIFPASKDEFWARLEEAILKRGMQILRVNHFNEAVYRLENEIFSLVILEDDARGDRQKQLADMLRGSSFGSVTPVVVLGPGKDPGCQAALTSLLDQYFPISTDVEVIAEFVVETHELRKKKAKHGSIRPISAPQILFQASRFRLSGAVVLERGDGEKCVIYLENGMVVFASSNRDENRFGEFLVSRGVITRPQLDHAIEAIRRSNDKRMGRVLVDEGFLKPQVLQTLLQSQIKHIVFTVFDWIDGEFYVLFDEQCQRENAIARVEVAPLIMEGVRYKLNEKLLSSEFEPFDSNVSLSTSLAEIQKRMPLSKDEVDFLKLIDKGRAIEELIHLNSYSRLEALRLLYGFRVLGILTFQRGFYPAGKAMPARDERSRAVDELFSPKENPSHVPREEISVSRMIPKPRAARFGFVIGSVFTGASLTFATILFTVLDTRTSKEGKSLDRERVAIVMPAAAAPTPIPTAAPTSLPAAATEMVKENQTVASLPSVGSQPSVSSHSSAMSQPSQEAEQPPAEVSISPYEELIRVAVKQKKAGRLHDALATYKKALKFDPNQADTLIVVGDLLSELDRQVEAIEYYETAKKLDPSDPRPYLGLGTLYLMRSQNEQARVSLRAYLVRVEPTYENRTRIMEVQRILKNIESQP